MRPDSRISSSSQAAGVETAEPKMLLAEAMSRLGHEHQRSQNTAVHSSSSNPPKGRQITSPNKRKAHTAAAVCVTDIYTIGKDQSESPEPTAKSQGRPCPRRSRERQERYRRTFNLHSSHVGPCPAGQRVFVGPDGTPTFSIRTVFTGLGQVSPHCAEDAPVERKEKSGK